MFLVNFDSLTPLKYPQIQHQLCSCKHKRRISVYCLIFAQLFLNFTIDGNWRGYLLDISSRVRCENRLREFHFQGVKHYHPIFAFALVLESCNPLCSNAQLILQTRFWQPYSCLDKTACGLAAPYLAPLGLIAHLLPHPLFICISLCIRASLNSCKNAT